MSYHILPVTDTKSHTLSADCECKPVVENSDPKTGEPYSEPMIKHRSFSGQKTRWKVEQDIKGYNCDKINWPLGGV